MKVLGVCLLLTTLAVAQTAGKKSQNPAAAKCHATIMALEPKDSDYFAKLSSEELDRLRDSTYKCVEDYWDVLPKYDMALAAWALFEIAGEARARGYAEGYFQAPWKEAHDPLKTATPASTAPDGSFVPWTTPPHSGSVFVHPLSLGTTYQFRAGSQAYGNCRVTSADSLWCPAEGTQPAGSFVALIAAQEGREYLLGCVKNEWNTSAQACVHPGIGAQSVLVHDQAVTFYDTGLAWSDERTGKPTLYITPVLSVLTRLK